MFSSCHSHIFQPHFSCTATRALTQSLTAPLILGPRWHWLRLMWRYSTGEYSRWLAAVAYDEWNFGGSRSIRPDGFFGRSSIHLRADACSHSPSQSQLDFFSRPFIVFGGKRGLQHPSVC